uniref:Oxidized purine nucleoside triphosphate hydrolase n=1 Tax=Chromera velia CCMP2878 TaxID=1169474 RepID=A0A0G4G249_9ALVE|eukprot:Cvel_19892.t1-p1 / transcript=Cvel_19892.t1 / gene=Cvel_19892 / organism=Chromera_velia_CCMP2878 / gene_product=7,8-dihydro-8-oxoguanine triphosphatase, putative / transcript_product=7,8-dihydro-8-oxoguanine triphosphatase, putative / location=Cvel_scaffold1746:15814-17239(-) / protein_length=365 / sequence_SO=supercontig / SO=protein_coding / is_pseudo=false
MFKSVAVRTFSLCAVLEAAAQVRPRKLYSVVFVYNEDKTEMLMGYKKIGFGQGKYNGFGGKKEDWETTTECAYRELAEESGLIAHNMKLEGLLRSTREEPDSLLMDVYMFSTDRWEGTITESDEMAPVWFPVSEIPFHSMWPDNKEWFNLILEDERFIASFVYNDRDEVVAGDVRVVSDEEISETLRRDDAIGNVHSGSTVEAPSLTQPAPVRQGASVSSDHPISEHTGEQEEEQLPVAVYEWGQATDASPARMETAQSAERGDEDREGGASALTALVHEMAVQHHQEASSSAPSVEEEDEEVRSLSSLRAGASGGTRGGASRSKRWLGNGRLASQLQTLAAWPFRWFRKGAAEAEPGTATVARG